MAKAKQDSEDLKKLLRQKSEAPEFPTRIGNHEAIKKKIVGRQSTLSDREEENTPLADKASSFTAIGTGTPSAKETSTSILIDELFSSPLYWKDNASIEGSDDEGDVYPNVSDDPSPIDEDSTAEQKGAHTEEIRKYTNSILRTYINLGLEGEELWQDFITAFRPQTIKLWDRDELTKWCKYLRDNGIHVGTSRKTHMSNHLIGVLYRPQHCPTPGYAGKTKRMGQEELDADGWPDEKQDRDEVKKVKKEVKKKKEESTKKELKRQEEDLRRRSYEQSPRRGPREEDTKPEHYIHPDRRNAVHNHPTQRKGN